MIGIPLFCLSIANLSIAIGNLFRTAYYETIQLFKRNCCSNNENKANKNKTKSKEKTNDLLNCNIGPSFISNDKILNNNKLVDKNNNVSETESDEDDDETGDTLNNRVRIPLAIAILILAVYIMIGAFVFKNTESNWNNTQSAYFAFITMATIGLI